MNLLLAVLGNKKPINMIQECYIEKDEVRKILSINYI